MIEVLIVSLSASIALVSIYKAMYAIFRRR